MHTQGVSTTYSSSELRQLARIFLRKIIIIPNSANDTDFVSSHHHRLIHTFPFTSTLWISIPPVTLNSTRTQTHLLYSVSNIEPQTNHSHIKIWWFQILPNSISHLPNPVSLSTTSLDASFPLLVENLQEQSNILIYMYMYIIATKNGYVSWDVRYR